MVHCVAITEQSEPEAARAEGIAQIILIIQIKKFNLERHLPKHKSILNQNLDRDTQGLVHCSAITERQRARRSPGRRHRQKNKTILKHFAKKIFQHKTIAIGIRRV